MTAQPPPTFETIRFAVEGNVAKITLNRPQRLNAAPPQMFAEIHQALKALPDLGARALLVTGEGCAFCSGADLQAHASANAAPQTTTRGERSFKALTETYGRPCWRSQN